MKRIWVAALLLWAGCAGPPLPADPHALGAELESRARILRDVFASLQAEGNIVIEGSERIKLTWRAEAVRGQWARAMLSSPLASDPVVELRFRAGEGLAVRVSPPGSRPTVYRAPSDDLSASALDGPARIAAEWLTGLARDHDLAIPSPSDIQVTDGSVRLEFTQGPLVSRVRLRRSDGMPLDFESLVSGDPARACLLGHPRGDRTLRVAGTPLLLPGDVEATLVACCDQSPLVSIRLAVAHLTAARPAPLSRWLETARPIERIRDDRWMRRTFRDAEAMRAKTVRACPGPPSSVPGG